MIGTLSENRGRGGASSFGVTRPIVVRAPAEARAFKILVNTSDSHATAREEFILSLEERQAALVEVNARLSEIRERLRSDAANAYYDLLILLNSVRRSPLDFDKFTVLEWREFCIGAA